MKSSILLVLLSCVLSCVLFGCGVKPGAVDSPAGAQDQVFPRTYPDLQTDPQTQDHK